MIEKSVNIKKLEAPRAAPKKAPKRAPRRRPKPNVSPIMAAYFLGYLQSQNGEKIAEDLEEVEKLYIGTCLSMGIGPVEDISELFQALFGLGQEEDDDKPLQYYA
ncbi:hypothetical protein [Methanobrevibacter sp.]|uniref:hypothetical protein n=1 Tax=Methanobrevibacter sp. TaxID=66852 RepID=UPI0025E3AFB8|nr:hypothetical protein [Methanobrevibacter sp.]MBQ2962190.1 hypothetical protein [Methanobrevibacter sp.]